MRKIIFIILSVPLLLFGDSDHHESKKEHKYLRHEGIVQLDMNYLELNELQKSEIAKSLNNLKKNLKAIKKDNKIDDELEEIFINNNFNYALFLSKVKEKKDEISRIEAQFLKELHDILTASQREKFAKNIEKWEID